ncbi:hypothetical protein OF83DRAFT_1105504 [Amylostereum chailletii]|nr:hypothetical protein OF83DRAFT_1105504 [Amylostereum chailletii]
MRARPSSHQTEELRKAYARNSHPTKEDREELCSRIGMRYQSVTNWFQNQRSLAKRRQEEEDAALAAARRASASASTSTLSRSARRHPPYPPASDHPSLPLSLSSILNRDERSPSLEPSTGSASSRASPYPIMPAHRPRRTRPEPHQLAALKRLYRSTATPSIEERGALALQVGM